MKVRGKSFSARMATLLLGGIAIAASPASAQILPPDPEQSIWFQHGAFEAGGNIFLERPPTGFGKTTTSPFWLTPLTSDSRAKFEEYGAIPRGLFLEYLNLRGGTTDGRYYYDFLATDVGANNQRFLLDLFKVGEHYLALEWDQTPHLISTSAKSLFGGVGTNRLIVDPATKALLFANLPPGGGAQTQAQRDAIDLYINTLAPMRNITLQTQRDRFSMAFRTTPTTDLDFKVDYSNERRTGLRPLGIGFGVGAAPNPRPSSGAIEVPQPLDDTIQNVNASGEYVGTTSWGTRWVAALKYAGSFYDNSIKSMDVDNPFCSGCSPAGPTFGGALMRYGLYPSNNANAVTLNASVELPLFKSRYTNTTQYTVYQQNDPFIDTATNGITVGGGATQLRPYPASGLNGEVNALLSSHVLTSRFTKELTNTVRVRYYDYKDNTPPITFLNYVYADGGVSSAQPLTRMPTSYTKLDVSDELKWRATNWLTVGGGLFFQRYTYEHSEVDLTNESTGKIFVDATPWEGANVRTSYLYSQRRYGTYEPTGSVITDNARLFMIANRDRHKAETFIELSMIKDVTITPNAGLRFDDYPDSSVPNLLGTTKDHSWNAGVDLGIRLSSDVRLSFGYNYEEHQRHLAVCCGTTAGVTAGNIDTYTWTSDVIQRYHTFTAGANWMVLPGRFEIRFDYLLALANEGNFTTPCSVGNVNCTGGGTGVPVPTPQFPDEKNNFQRFNAVARYTVDPDVVRRMGWAGDVIFKLRYTWERNRNVSWATDTMTPYTPSPDQTPDLTGAGRSLFLAYANPNYTAQIIAMSLAIKW